MIKIVPPKPGSVQAAATDACQNDWLNKLKSMPDFRILTQGGKSDFYYVFRIAFMAGAVWMAEWLPEQVNKDIASVA